MATVRIVGVAIFFLIFLPLFLFSLWTLMPNKFENNTYYIRGQEQETPLNIPTVFLNKTTEKDYWESVEKKWQGIVNDPNIKSLVETFKNIGSSQKIEAKNLAFKPELKPINVAICVIMNKDEDTKHIQQTWVLQAASLNWTVVYSQQSSFAMALESISRKDKDWYIVIKSDTWIDAMALQKSLNNFSDSSPFLLGYEIPENATLHPNAGVIVNSLALKHMQVSNEFQECIKQDNYLWPTMVITNCSNKYLNLTATQLEGTSPYSRLTIAKMILNRELQNDLAYKNRHFRLYYNTVLWGGNGIDEFYANNNSQSIPKILHQVWIGDSNKDIEKLLASCRTINEQDGWTVKLWNKELIEQEVGKKFVSFYNLKNNNELLKLVDTFRIYTVFKYGGIYLDADSYCIRPLTSIINDTTQECFYTHESNRHKTLLIANSGFGCRPFTKTQDLQLRRVQEIYDTDKISQPAWIGIGPIFITVSLLHYKSWVNFVDYPSDYFFPVHFQDFAKYPIPSNLQVKYARYKNSYTAQFFRSSVNMLGDGNIEKLKRKLKRVLENKT